MERKELLKGFTLITQKTTGPFVTIRKRSVTLSKAAVELMGFPTAILTYIKDGQAAFLGDPEGDKLNMMGGRPSRFCNVHISKCLLEKGAIDGDRIYGEVVDGVLLITLPK